jgi:hypothetical protein
MRTKTKKKVLFSSIIFHHNPKATITASTGFIGRQAARKEK